jgi:4-amino-4-deoxy-L-arabinose transferase-like glycosyltransferase
MAEVTNTAPDVNPMDANLRLLDGRVQKYLGGFTYHLTGGTVDGLNQPWEWGPDDTYNLQNGNVPSPEVLLVNRMAGALLLALCVPAAFGIGMSIGSWPAALIFPALIALSPNILLNGRRAMMEAPLMLFSLLTVLSALRWGQKIPLPLVREEFRERGVFLILLGLSAGLALSSKHSGVLVITPVFGALGLLTLWRRNWRGLTGLIIAGIGALGVFYLFNPAWWPQPVNAAQTVLRLRSELLAGQVGFFGGYANFSEQIAGFWRQTFIAVPQFYEIPDWVVYIGDQIATYQASPWGGLSFGTVGGLSLALLTVLGALALIRRRDTVAWIFGVYALGTILAAVLFTPLEWARYYLVGLPAIYGLSATGASFLIRRGRA